MGEIDDDKGADKVMWAEEVENEMGLPARQETIKDGLKTVTEYHFDDDDRRVKRVTQYKIVTKKVPKAVATRKKWAKFGQADRDPPGPNTANTTMSEEIKMQFIRSRSGELLDIQRIDDDPITKLKGATTHQCRYCKSPEHWSTQCPYKDMFEEQRANEEEAMEGGAGGAIDARTKQQAEDKMKGGTYVPPSMRGGGGGPGGARGPGATMMDRRDDFTVRVTNLPEDTTDQDLKDLFSMTGKVLRIYLAKDKQTQRCKGFAFVTYGCTEDADKAIKTITGHRYDHLILKVEWAKPSTT